MITTKKTGNDRLKELWDATGGRRLPNLYEAALEAELLQLWPQRDELLAALTRMVVKVDGVDNGYCRLCGAHRLHDTRGNLGRCENRHCISHEVLAAIAKARGEKE
jgi:hypothetical protein